MKVVRIPSPTMRPACDNDPPAPEVHQENPVVLFSGWEPQRMINAVRQLRSLVALRKVHREPMSAMVVPRAMPKKMSQLVDEIRGDFELNRRAT
eukprot:s6044_g4.t1